MVRPPAEPGVTFCGHEAQLAAAARLQQAVDALNVRWPRLPWEGHPPLGVKNRPPFKIALIFLGGVAIGHWCEQWEPEWATDRDLDYSGLLLPPRENPIEIGIFVNFV
ncbi:hypothetical protein JCM10212_003487 [Sporobolomyces blumeae]